MKLEMRHRRRESPVALALRRLLLSRTLLLLFAVFVADCLLAQIAIASRHERRECCAAFSGANRPKHAVASSTSTWPLKSSTDWLLLSIPPFSFMTSSILLPSLLTPFVLLIACFSSNQSYQLKIARSAFCVSAFSLRFVNSQA